MQHSLSLHNIYFSQSRTVLLEDISLSLNKGEVVGLLGVNGAGKSTTLKIASGLIKPTTGHVSIAQQQTTGYLPETPPLIDHWQVKSFLSHVCVLHGLPRSQRGGSIDSVISSCNLEKIIHQPIATLSKGNRQRVAIAAAIIHRPDILILDEPTSGLDPQQISQFRDVITTLRQDTAILFSSHIMHEITSLCDRVSIIHQGQQKKEIALSQQQQDILIHFFTDIPENNFQHIKQWQSGTGKTHIFSITNSDEQQQLIAQLSTMGLPIARITGTENILENTFLQVIGQTNSEHMTTL